MHYRLSLPRAKGPRPVLCFLHGYGEAASNAGEEGLTRHGPLWAGAPASVARRFLIVVPQLPIAGDLWHRHAGEVRRCVKESIERHEGDPRRAYLTGFSFGGNGVFDLALLQPDFWAALWAVDPTRVPPHALPAPLWLSFGGVARSQKGHFLESLRVADRFADEGDDHVGAARRAYGDERIYSWLLEHSASAR